MLSVDGWILIWLTLDDWDVPSDTQRAVRELKSVIVDLGLDRDGSFDLVNRNGDHVLRVHLNQRREDGPLQACRELLDEVTRIAPGSFGVLFVRDADEPAQTMQRFVMRRGRVVFEDDDVFNPNLPTDKAR